MIIKVKVKPNSKEEKIEKISDLLSKALDVSYKDIKIKNPTSREKIIEVKTEK